jgi:N-acetylglucosamine-6-sulfatase
MAAQISSNPTTAPKPNFIFIMTDDQDLHLNSLDYQPSVQKHFAQQGTWFKKHFCTVALCCPSRVSLLTGKAAHNTNVTDVSAPYGKSCHASSLFWERQALTADRWISKIY